MKERGNYETMRKATHLYTKEIRGDRGDHGGRSPFVLISMITPVLAGSSGLRICRGVRSPGDGRHQEPRQASAITSSNIFYI
jgi:hypothetical protein